MTGLSDFLRNKLDESDNRGVCVRSLDNADMADWMAMAVGHWLRRRSLSAAERVTGHMIGATGDDDGSMSFTVDVEVTQ